MGSVKNNAAPHIYAVAQNAFSSMVTMKQNQAVIISGESGAGKTESTKFILQYLTAITTNQSWIEQQIMEANTILESFGNAKTVRNNNSSRFGKFVQVLFDAKQDIIGAAMVNYLLEKSRIVTQASNERNYHVFYQLVYGANAEEREEWEISGHCQDYRYLNQSGKVEVPDIDDKKDFQDLKFAFAVLKMSEESTKWIFKVIAALLHLGNIRFSVGSDGESVEVMEQPSTQLVAKLLQLDEDKLLRALKTRRFIARGETTFVPLKIDQARDNVDSISKNVYDALFQVIVNLINQSTAAPTAPKNFIGVLDIFGFELFEVS